MSAIPTDTELKAATLRLKSHLFGTRYDLGFIGIGTNEIVVYVHGSRRQWEKLRVMEWEGFPVRWRYRVGPIVALASEFA